MQVPIRDSRSTFLRESADVLAADGPLPFQELARRVLATGRVATTGRTPKNTLFSLLSRAHRRGYTVDGRKFGLFKVGARLWVKLDESGGEPNQPGNYFGTS